MVRDDRPSVVPAAASIPSDRVAPAWVAAGVLLLALVGLTALLPGPADLLTVTGSGAATVDATVLAGAALLVWALTAWVAVVLAVALVGVLPGACGRHARRLLALIAPRLALRLVAVAVGASALAGTTACSAPIFASATAPAAATTESTVTASPQVLDPSSADTTAPTSAVQIDIDWPSATGTPAAVPTPSASPPSTADPSPASVSTSTPPSPSGAAVAPSTTVTGPSASAPAPAAVTPPAAPFDTTNPADATAPIATAAAPQRDAVSPVPEQVVTRPSGAPIVVQPGDTLWALAAESLPDGAGDAAVDAAWHQWYALNRDVIGGDPDLLQPGQHLVPPPADAPTTDQENDR